MCGIAGKAGPTSGSVAHITAMTETMRHRGPDDYGFHVQPGVELGMRRLAIIDVQGGKQPVTDEISNITVVFNGEIYNFEELRAQLKSAGHLFMSNSDSEVIAHLVEAFGIDGVSKLRGMFAIAVWKSDSRELFLVRDRLGKKPLVFAVIDSGDLLFASETRALLADLRTHENGLAPNFSALNSALTFGYIPAPENAFAGVHTLPPATIMRWHEGSSSSWKYWEPPHGSPENWSEAEAIEQCLTSIDESVKIRMMSERPMGAFLSGGIDSTIVTALMARHSSYKISTFSVGFNHSKYDESIWARRVAQHVGTDHHELIIDPEPSELLGIMQSCFDQPFADSSAIPTFLVSQFASQSVVVALTGDGGDEAFSGYDRYKFVPALQRMNILLGILSPVSGVLEQGSNALSFRRISRLSRELHFEKDLATRYQSAMTMTSLKYRNLLWNPEINNGLIRRMRPEDWFQDAWLSASKSSKNLIETMSLLDMATYLPGDLLVKVDIASMANSLETRSPLLDHKVIETAAKIPYDLRVHNGQSKYILKQIARSLVPPELINRPKMGFAIPRAAWLRGPLREMSRDLLTDNSFVQRGWFNLAPVRRLLDQHDKGLDRDHIIWPLLMIELWARQWLDT